MNTKSHLTAKKRSNPSKPMRILNQQGLLKGKMLDYGCGQGFDADFFKMDAFDPHYNPKKTSGKYDTITCNYVLNVVEEEQGHEIINTLSELLKDGGIAYLTVRRDIKKELGKEGYTSKGTYQRNVELPLPKLKETSSFCIYMICK